MHGERRLRHLTAPRVASLLEMEKHGNGKGSGVEANCSDATVSGQNSHAARVAVGAWWICHRDIINLKQGVSLHAALQAAPRGADITISIRAELPASSSRSMLPSACDLRSGRSPPRRKYKASNGSTTRPGLFAQPAGHRMMVPGTTPRPTNERASCTNSVRIRNAP
jgi:hypothetical protein